MRFLNMNQLANIPDADPNFGSAAEVAKRRMKAEQLKRQLIARQREQAQIEANAARRRELDAQSRRLSGHNVAYARGRQGMGFVPQYGVHNPLLGFVDEVPGSAVDFDMHTAQPVEEFCNGLSAKNLKYTEYQDFPMVLDAPKGDFSGILVDEAHSADFSERIYNDDRQDFGYTPRRPMRRHRR